MAPTYPVLDVPSWEPSTDRLPGRFLFSHLVQATRRSLRRTALALGLLAGLAAPAAAQVVSHGFEDGTTQGWSPRGAVSVTSSDDVARSGSRSLKTTGRTANWNGPAIDLRTRLAANTTYQISGWVRLVAGQPASDLKFTVEMRETGAAGNSYVQVNTPVTTTDAEWVQVQGTFSYATPSMDLLTLYLESSDPTSAYYLDDFSIAALSAPGCPEPHDQSGLATDFENGMVQGWSPRGGVELVPTNETAATGSYSLRVTNRTATWQGPSINVLCKMHKGSKYLIGVRVRLLPGEDPAQVRVTLERRFNGTTSYHPLIGDTAVTDAGWVDLTTEYTFGLDAEALQLYVEANGNQSFYIDDFELTYLPPIPIEEDIPSLHEVLSEYFPVGAAIEPGELAGSHRELLLKHFNLLVAGNAMKWSSLQPTEGNFNFGPADAIANFARENGLRMRGHTLVWHSQTPDWVFQDAAGNPLQPGNAAHRQLLLDRIETHIHTVVTRYADIVDWWDVVNEPIDVSQPNGLRNSPWYQIIGPEYIDWAFEFASEVAGDAKLVINDYNTHQPAKRDRLAQVVQGLLDRGIRVDAVGHQTHIRVTWPPLSEIADSLDVFTALGLENEITELDVSVYSDDSDTSAPTQEQLVAQGYRYRDLFDLFRAKSDQISTVTFWGMADDNTWLKTFPITRDDKPLLFDEDLQSKPAFWGVVDPNQLPVIPKVLPVTQAKSALQIAAGLNSHWDIIAPTPLATGDDTASWGSFKAVWRGDMIYVVVEVDDDTRQRADRVEVFVGEQRYAFAGVGLHRTKGAVGLIVPTRDGYRLIAGVPLGAVAQVGDEVRFDLRVTDAATGRQLSWSDTHHTQDETTDNLGTFRLLPQKNIETVRRGTVVIDGQRDKAWKNASSIETRRFVLGTSGAMAKVELLWDEGHLYVYAVVSDPLLSKASPNVWEQDSVELFVDENNAQGLAYDNDDAQYRVNFDNEVTVGGSSSASRITSATRVVSGGYVVEAAIALDPDTTGRGAVIGFDLQVNDDSGAGARTSVATWNDASGNAYQDPSNFGALLLK